MVQMLSRPAAVQQRPISHAWFPLRFHPEQQRLWQSQARLVAVVAGRGSGKSEIAKRKLVMALATPKPWRYPRYFYAAPTLPQAKRVAWDDCIELIPRSWIRNINRTECCIETIFDSELWIFGLDSPQRIEGLQWDGCVIDESCDQKPRSFDLSVFPALAHRDGWAWRIGAAKRHGCGAAEFREFYENAARGELENVDAFTWSAEGILPESQLDYLRSHMDAVDFAEQMEGQWQTIGGGIYFAFDEAYNLRPCSYDINKSLIVGSDFNVDPLCWVFGHRSGEKLEWFDELFLRNSNTQEALNETWSRYNRHRGGFEFYGDATAKSRSTSASQSDYNIIESDERFRSAGRSVCYPDSNPNQADRWAAVNAMFCNANKERRMFVSPRCKHLVADLKRAGFKPGSRDPVKKGDIGHITDAMGYVVHWMFPVRVELQLATGGVSTH